LSYFNAIWDFFSSVKLGVVLLLTLATTSIIGTFIPQNQTPDTYLNAYGDFWYRFFGILDFFNMYHSGWFQFLLLLLCINIIICSIDRLSATWKIIFTKTPRFNFSRFRRLSNQKELISEIPQSRLMELCEPIVAKGFTFKQVEERENGFCIFAEKYRWSRLGVYTVHMSILLLLLGALIGSFYGFEGYVNIPEGETIGHIRQHNSSVPIPLGFEIKCDDYSETYYDTGTPKEFRSKLTIIENNKPLLQKDIIVNNPLRYKGINIFQSSRGKMNPIDMTLNITYKENGTVFRKKVKMHQQVDIPENLGIFTIHDYHEAYRFRGQNLGEVFIGTFKPQNGKPFNLVLPTRFPTFDQMRNGAFAVSISDPTFRYYTGLQVTKDPGVWLVYSGFIIIIIGCYITFYLSHQQIFLEVSKRGNSSQLMISGTANKNKLAMDKKVEKIFNRLIKLTTSI